MARRTRDHVYDVLVVGGGPSGSACAYWLAEAGWDVAVVEKKRFPREKTCGDGLTPRAVRQLADMGLEHALAGAHRYRGPALGRLRSDPRARLARACPGSRPTATRSPATTSTRWWPSGPPRPGATVCREPRRSSRSRRRRRPAPGELAGCAGAVVAEKGGGRAEGDPGPLRRGGRRRQLALRPVARHRPRPRLPPGHGPAGLLHARERHDEPWIESHLDIRDADGDVVPGYGWIFPLGDGRVNVGVGLLSTDQRWKGVNTTRAQEAFVA